MAGPAAGEIDDIFLSYAREDRECAERLADALTACGWRVWWDREIDVGADFAALIESQLQRCRAVIVLWSEHSVRSAFVKDEAGRALATSKLHPVRIADVPLPLGFGQIQTADLLDCATSGEDFDSLVAQLRRALSAPGVAEPPVRRAGPLRHLLTRKGSVWIAAALTLAILAMLIGRSWLVERRCNEAFVRIDAGVQKLQEGSSEQAIDFFTDAIRMCRSSALAYRYRGQAYARLNDYPLAVADLQVALRLGLEGYAARRVSELLAQIEAAQQSGALVVASAATDDTAAAHPPPVTTVPPVTVTEPPVGVPAPTSGGSVAPPMGEVRPPAAGRGGYVAARPRPPATAGAAPAMPEVDARTRSAVKNMFASDADTRIGATTSLLIDGRTVNAAVPLALETALAQPRNASGVVNTLVLLQSAGPLALQQHRAEIERLLTQVQGNGPQTADLAAKVRAAMTPIVFIQIASEAQRPLAERLRAAISDKGFDVPGIENVSATADVPAAAPEVRLQGRSGRAAAQQIGNIVQELTGATPRLLTIGKAAPKVDTYEVWLDRRSCVDPQHRPPACAG